MSASTIVPSAIGTVSPTVEVWLPGDGKPVTVNVGRHICDEWYHYYQIDNPTDKKIKSITTGQTNPDELDGLFDGLRRIPNLTRFAVEHDTITLHLRRYADWRRIQPYVERAIARLPEFEGSSLSFALHR